MGKEDKYDLKLAEPPTPAETDTDTDTNDEAAKQRKILFHFNPLLVRQLSHYLFYEKGIVVFSIETEL